MKVTDEQLQEILDEVQPSIVKGLKTEMAEYVRSTIIERAKSDISEYVSKWVAENVFPELESALAESKEGLVSIGVELAGSLVTLLVEAITKDFAKRLESNWSRREILKVLFE